MTRLMEACVCLGALALAGPALAQDSASQTTTGSAQVIQPITLTKASDLQFGAVVKPSLGSNTISIDETTGARSIGNGGDAALVAGGGSRAAYTVSGEGAQAFSITAPNHFDMVRDGGADTLKVTLEATSTGGTLSGSAGSAGSASFGVGGSFQVHKTTPEGSYSGSFDVSVAYN